MDKFKIIKDKQYYKFCSYGFLKNLRFFEPFLLLFFYSKGISFLQIGILYAIREIAINIFEIPSGIIADALGRRKTLASSFLVYIIAFILFYLYSSFLLFAFAMLFYALGDAIRSGINKAMIVDYLKRTEQIGQKVKYYGHTRSWSQLGSALSSLAGGILYFFNENLNAIFLFSIIPYLVDFVNVLSYPKYLDEYERKHISAKDNIKFITNSFIQAFRKKELLHSLINSSIYSGYYKAMKDFIQPFLKSLAIAIPIFLYLSNEEKIGIFLGLTYFIIFLTNSILSRYSSKIESLFNSQAAFLNISLLVGVFIGLMSGILMEYYNSFFAVILFVIVLSIENSRKPSGVANITDNCDDNIHAGILSVQSQLASVFAASIMLLIGFFADLYSVGAGIILSSLVILLFYPLMKVKQLD
ncbi:MAG: MFS transporter [Ignavibacteriales bacterium CG18_big_fil_WC_8_21_14_2_50_31_20]|nr:MAG: MFS transporter [Ignavibacteriales bacterium CG18_big_fil_WC_8_21_14_2_50_31_20]